MTNDTNTRKKANAVFFAAVMVVSMFAAGFAGSAAAATTGASITEGSTAVSAGPGESATIQNITVADANGGNGNQVEIDNISVAKTGGGAITAADVDQIELVVGGQTIATNDSVSSLSDVRFGTSSTEFSSNGAFSNTDTDSDSEDELVLDDGGSEVIDVVVTFTSDAEVDGDTLSTTTTVNLLSDAQSGSTVEAFSGPSYTSTSAASSALTLNDGEAPNLQKATHYVSGDSSIGATIELVFDENVDTSTIANSDITVGLDNGNTLNLGSATSAGASSSQLFVNTSNTVYNNVQNVSISGVDDNGGNTIDDTFDVTFAPSTVYTPTNSVAESDFFDAFSGENVAIEGAEDDAFDIDGPGVSRTRGSGSNSQIYVLDTDDFEVGEYNITNSANEEVVLNIRSLGLSVEADEGNFTTNDAVTATVTSDTINREITADLLDSDGDVVDTVDATIDSDGEVSVDFGTQSETGTYTIEVTDVNSAVTAESGDFDINEAPEGDVSFEQGFITEERGDTANITINFQGDIETATLRVGDDDEVGYESNITVDSGGEDSVTVAFNTYVAGNTSTLSSADLAYVADADSDAEVTGFNESVDDLANMLATGTYPLALSSEN
ncbi:hypothetical protein EXE43_17980, partial [Halorubrum sp. SS5]